MPQENLKLLFIGTFNPIWQVKKGLDPEYFYSRSASQFWCILPHALNKHCLIDKDIEQKKAFAENNEIGLTDLIYCINNVSELNEEHKKFLTSGFKDEDFEKFEGGAYNLDITFYTKELKKYIERNQKTLKGVFFTRKTFIKIPRLLQEWLEIKSLCRRLKIYSKELPSPSPRGGGIRDKIFEWRREINNALEQ